MADEYNPGSSGDGYYFNYRKTLHDPIQAKTCYFYKDNDYKQAAAKVAIHPKRYRKFDNLLSELTRLIPSLPFGVRSVYTPRGRSHIYNTDSLMHEGRYICSTHGHFARGVDVARVCPPDTWHLAKPASGQRQLNVLLQEHEYDEFSRAKRRRLARSGGIIYSGKRPKKITVMRNGDPSFRHLMLLNRKTAQTFDQVMEDMSDMFKFAVRKLYTIDGRRITSLAQLFNGPDVLVVAGHEQFKAMVGFMYTPMPPSTRGGSLRSARDINTSNKRRTRRDRLIKSRGKWRVSVVTGDEPSAGTSAQVILTIYGQKGNSGPLNLGDPDGNYFESGNSNDFEIFAPGIGEIYKIRIGHDETGSHPAWYCEEVRLSDVDTGEELVFVCQEWMDSERGDQETCREIPVKRKGEPTLPVVTYEATVTTGDLWNSGTHANVYLTIYGDRGDTGVRQLKPAKANSFQQGQSDVFQIEAVSLGRLKRIIVGHDGTGQGNGWNLERIVVKDPIKNEYFNFYCGKWLDEGEDDGKIVREIQAQEEYMGDILEKRNWESEKWKFDSKNQIKLISELTGKALRIKGDGSVDAMGDLKEEWVVFNVTAKKSMVRSFGSLLNKNYHLAIDNGRTVGHGKGGAYCDFRIHVQHDLTVLLESVKYPLQFLTLLDNGRPADPRGGVDTDSSRIFYVYCKGMFRNRGVIMLRTSKTQTLAQDSEEGMYGTGKINRTAHFKVHKVAENGVRMFESLINPGRFIRMQDKRIDCQGGKDEDSHFIVAKYPDKGYITLESATQRGLFIGLTPDGELKPTVDTGGKNVCLYPEVIEFGIPKRRNLDYDYDNYDDHSQAQTHRSPRTPKTPRSSRLEDGMWKITVSSAETLKNGDVSLVAYGDKGNTGPITLAAPAKNGPIFQSGSVDEFTANLSKAGKLFKVRLEVEPKNKNNDALWKVREVKMEDLKSKEIIKLTFNRWLSPIHDDGSIVRELPVAEDEDDKLPVLTYSVMVYTGKEKGAATAANVYVNLFGENGDCGRRLLHQTKNSKKFQAGQVDVFEVEGVYLGRLSKCLVGHDGTGAGDGWFLDKIVVRESSTSKVEYVFPCNKWLDSGKDDRIIERMLPVSDAVIPVPPSEIKVRDTAVNTTSDESVHKSQTKSNLSVPSQPPSNPNKSESSRSPRPTSTKVNSKNSMNRRRNSNNGNGTDFQRTISLSPSSPTDIPSKYAVLPPISGSKEEEVSQAKDETENGANSLSKSDSIFESQELDSIEEEEEEEIVLPVPEKSETIHTQVSQLQDNLGSEDKDSPNKEKTEILDKEASINSSGPEVEGNDETEEVHTEIPEKEGSIDSPKPIEETNKTPKPLDAMEENNKTPKPSDAVKENNKTSTADDETHSVSEQQDEQAPDSENNPSVSEKPEGTSSEDRLPPLGQSPDLVEESSPEELTENNDTNKDFQTKGRESQEVTINEDPEESTHPEKSDVGKVSDDRTDTVPDQPDHEKDRIEDSKSVKSDHYGEVEQDEVTERTEPEDASEVVPQVEKIDSDRNTDNDDEYVQPVTENEDNDDEYVQPVTEIEDNDQAISNNTAESDFNQTEETEQSTQDTSPVIEESLDSKIPLADSKDLQQQIENENSIEKANDSEEIATPKETNAMLERTVAKEPLQEKPKDGDWKVYVTTGNQQDMGTDNKIELYVYGSGEVRGPIPLGVGKKGGPFQSGQTDEIKVNLGTKLKELQKIRIGFDGRTHGDWFLEEVKLENLSNKEEYQFKIKRWLSKSHDDGDTWREAAVVKKGEATPINAIYTVEVTTGNLPKADTSADVYINIYGKKADCGKRYLHAPNYKDKPFQIGKTNIFEIEAVPLGEFDKIIVGHTGKAIGAGWFLEKIIITDINGEESHFICNKWLDSGKGDKKIERVIYPDSLKTKTPVPATSKIKKDKPVQVKSTPVQPAAKKAVKTSPKPVSTSDRIYQLWVKTLKDSKPANGGSVSITAYGSEGKSHMIELLPEPGSKEKLFEPGNVDEFEVNVGDIGEIYKLQVTRDDTLTWEGWHLEEIRLLDKTSKEEAVFEYNCWLLRNDDGNSLVQELPVYKQNKPLHPVHTYRLSLYTGDHWAGETDSNVFITIFGRHGDTGKRGFYQPIKKPLKFRKGQIETFDVQAVDLDDLEKIVVGHDGKGHGAGWYLDKITVTETTGDKSHMQYIFPCGKWLDEGEGDGLTERELRLLDQNNSKERASTRSKSQSQGKWKVLVKTSDIEDAGTKARVYLTVFGSKDNTDTIPLGDGGVHSTDFDRGNETDFMISVGDIGDVIKIRLEHNNEGPEPSWHLDWLKLTREDTGEELVFYGDCWLAEDQGDKQICRELPFVKFGQTPLAVLQYIVCMQTGKDREAEATDSIVSINIIGQKGETGIRPLVNSISGNNILWKSGDVDYFMIEAADVGKINKIRVVFDGDDKENNWYLESVCIREGPSSILESMFQCQQWFEVKNKSDDVAIEFYPKEIKIASALPNNLTNTLPCKKFKASKGNWSITSYIGSQTDAGTNDPVYLTVFGSSSHSSPIQINKSGAFKPNSVVKTQMTLKDIGSIYKIAVSLHPSSKRSALFLNRLKLKDDDSQEEFNFEYNDWIKTSDESPEGTVYLPAIRPDIPPYPETTYLVKVTTGNISLAETDARIFCNLIGHLGESGEMPLTKATNGKAELFERGQLNIFEVSTLDIGNVKRMIIGHKEIGRGCGWYCEKVIVSPKTKGAAETIFICDRWFDSGCDDRNLMKEFSPLASLLPQDTIPQPVKTKSKGIWMCTVITADEDKRSLSVTSSNKNKQVSILIHGNKNVFGPKELSDKNRDLFQPGQKDIFHGLKLDSVGEVQKIQVSLGDNDSPSEWFIQEVLLRDEETGEVLRFDFSRWVGEIGADLKKEMPVIKSVDNFNKVLPYQVTVHTSEKKGAGTNSHICVTLYGKNSNSGRHKLLNEKSQPVFIKPGQVDKLQIECVDLGDLEKVVVWKGPGEPWLLERIIVKKQQYSSEEYVFEFNRWLSKDSRTREEEDTQTLTRLQPSNIVAPLDKSTKQQTSRGRYEIQTITAGGQSYTKISDIVVVFCGDKSESSPLQLDPQSTANFEPNQTKRFQVHVKDDVGELYKMRVGYFDNSQPKTWNLEKMIVQDVDSKDRFYHIFNDGIDVDDKLDGWKEFPVEWPAIAPLPVINYQIELHGDTKKPPNKNQLMCQLFGEKGSTGERILKKVVSQQKQVFLYQLEAVSLLNIYQVKLGHKNKKKGGGFHLQKLLVKEPQRGGREFIFECNQWFDVGEGDQMIERILSTAQGRPAPVASPVKTAPAPTPKPTPAPKSPEKKQTPNGDWKIEIQTSEVDDAGTDSNVMLTVFGNDGNSGPLPLGEKGIGFFEFGQSDEFEIWLEPSDIGKIRKIRLEHDNSGHGPGWHVDKVIMSNLGSKEEIIFPINRWLSYDDKYGDIVVEVPADIPNSKVPEVYRYYVETITSNDWGSGTDSNVYINIIGSLGDTGIRFLKNSLEDKNKFESGSTDSFEIEAVDIGKIQKIIIGHDGFGAGAGWKLDKVNVRQSRTSSEVFVFQYNKWLDEDKDDRKIETELKLTKTLTDNKAKLNF
ncbi:lipoxygenase homology domain-containing protein 1 [Patella vulgata]|uniref:lipoxygenase homology domain-containing protein 1 n=1 Tax=Patella vulgata TaxID=6465 RepID=UPI0024A7C61D|nr:lipoxygenase homology domain-containing protein 1 [Patella vulgata]